jgi:hypothetical protein
VTQNNAFRCIKKVYNYYLAIPALTYFLPFVSASPVLLTAMRASCAA